MGPDKAWGARYRPSYPLENFLSEALAISCRKTADLIINLLYNRSFVLFAVAKQVSLLNFKMCSSRKHPSPHTLQRLYHRFPSNFLQKVYVCWRCGTNVFWQLNRGYWVHHFLRPGLRELILMKMASETFNYKISLFHFSSKKSSCSVPVASTHVG